MTTYDADLLIVGGGPAGLATALYARRQGLSVIVAEPREGPIDKACGEGLMPGGLAELTVAWRGPGRHALSRDRVCAGEQAKYSRAEARFRTGPGPRCATHHVARRAGGTGQRARHRMDPDAGDKRPARRARGDGRRCAYEMVGGSRRTAFGGPARRRNQCDGRNTAALWRALALPGARVVGVRRSVLVALGRGVCDAGGTGPGRRRDPVRWPTRPCLVPAASGTSGGRQARAAARLRPAYGRWFRAGSRAGCCWWATRPGTKTP